MKNPIEDKILYAFVYVIIIIFTSIILYPVLYILSSSFSSPGAVSTGKVILWPVGFSLEGYKAVFNHKNILTGYANTIFYTVAGTLINVIITLVCAYPLSRKEMQFKKFYMLLFVFTMFFSGGLVPTYILMTQINFVNKIWVMIIPPALSVYNMIITRTFIMSSIPNELIEAANIDGCSYARYFSSILLPLSKPVVAVITLFYAVTHWNAYFAALIYLNDPKLYPLQLILREILVANQVNLSSINNAEDLASMEGLADLLKYSLIVVATAPILCVYPFAQRYFIKGVMIGSVKG